jgi:hypothetical protein
MAKVNMMRKLEPEDFTRLDLNEWRAAVRAKAMALIAAEYAESPYSHIAPLDAVWIDDALTDSIADATHDAWLKLED